jgi:caspase domain-containing protein
MGDKIAVIIAVERYRDARIQTVDYAEADAKDFGDVLELHGYKIQKLLIDGNATKTSMESQLKRGLKRLRSDDEFILYYAGHGFSKNGHNFLTSHDTDPDDLEATSVSLQQIFKLIDDSACKKVAVFLDSCESGVTKIGKRRALYSSMSTAELDEFFRDAEYRVCFSACKTDEYSYSTIILKHGIWTYHLIKALFGNAPEALSKGHRLTATSLQNYLSKAVPKTLRQVHNTPDVQTPWKYGCENRDFQIADLTTIIRKREQATPGAEQLKRILFREVDGVEIRSLSGFHKRFHHIPDNVSHSTQGFVESISKAEIDERMKEVFKAIKENMNYKSRDVDAESGRILTPDFEYATFCNQDRDDPSMAIITEELLNVKSPVFENEGFNQVFDKRFSQIVFEFPNKVDTKSLIESTEDLDRNDIEIDYDESRSWFVLSFGDSEFSVRVSRREFIFETAGMKTPKELLQGFYDVQKLIEGTPLIPKLKP